MKALLICPSDRENTQVVCYRQPLALVPVLGRSLMDRTIAHLARLGATEITVLTSDRPVMVRSAAAGGKPWGVHVEVISEARELTAHEARAKYQRSGDKWLPRPWDALPFEMWPNEIGISLWKDARSWFDSLESHVQKAGNETVGMKEFKPGVWIASTSHISPGAELQGPCWIGQHAWIAPGAILGPKAVIEEGAYVDGGAEVSESYVAPRTYVGEYVELRDSLSCGKSLLNWKRNVLSEVEDSFLLADISLPHSCRSTFAGRLAALFALPATLPLFLLAVVRSAVSGEKPLIRHRSVMAPQMGHEAWHHRTVVHYELNGLPGIWRRLPEILNVLRGDFRWVGNRPLSPSQARALASEFERLWLAAPTGIFSLSDAEPFADQSPDTALAQAAYYASCRSFRLDLSILLKALAQGFHFIKPDSHAGPQNPLPSSH